MNQVLLRLETALKLQHKHEHSTVAVEGTSFNHLKIADFGFSKLHHANQQGSTLVTYNIAGTEVYLDPEYVSTVMELKKALKFQEDYEIWYHKLLTDYNEIIHSQNPEIYDYMMKKELHDMFSMGILLQDGKVKINQDNLHISLEAIKLGTQNFSDCNCIGEGRLWKLYEGQIAHANGCTNVVAKRWDIKSRQRHLQFFTELDILQIRLKFNHENIIGLVGYCNEMNEKVIVYEHASNGRLDKYLGDPSLTWMKRLKICIDIANGLEFLHYGGVEQEVSFKHRDIKCGSILLDGDWNAKISNLELSRRTKVTDRAEQVDDKACDSWGYIDPDYQSDGFLTESSDIYSLGVILFEMLCGRLAWADGCEDHSQSLGPLAVRHYNEKGNLDEMIFEDIKEQIVPRSLTAFQTIAIQCLHDNVYDRPWTHEIIIQLKKALEFQEDYEIWEPKLPIDYKEIIQMSKAPEIYDYKMKKDLYDMFSKGILLQDDKVWFSLGSNGERNEMISAKRFSYKNHLLRKWRSIPESRFPKVKPEEFQKLKDVLVLKSKSKTDKFSPTKMKVKKDHMTWFWLSQIKRPKDEMLSAKKVVYNSSNVATQSSVLHHWVVMFLGGGVHGYERPKTENVSRREERGAMPHHPSFG
ncbi:hypothetical protein L1987_61201 [Smallanthus sonchifolius]|uniref:Uncharacterized protein n=1 Tax=Smallanthus sonchifolius TaxID=185202 RepID=A0ACB9DAE8_9ASTR|nr:hypothetical protein L1987_61201 [Smallanthus sonchifolius]